jgi:cell fate regulator YaaT (PSP1 superfamily)
LDLFTGDYVVVDSSVGFDIGTVSATGEIVRLQLKKYRVREDSEEMRSIQRIASEKDMEKYREAKAKENATLERARTIAFSLNLQMKISDIEMQGDGRKVIFFYTAENRVDFRELIRKYADEFKVKIEMRHISYREEASRLGGTGVCGRELCCSTWLTDYKQVNTGAARVQNLSINMEKLSGQCGRLKCCLNYELDQYVEAIDTFPKAKIVKLETINGVAYARKTDILKRLIWFSYEDSQTWVALEVDKVNACMEENKQGVQVASLQDLAPASAVLENVGKNVVEDSVDFIGNEELLKKDDEFRTDRLGNNRNHQNHRNDNRRDFKHNKEGRRDNKPQTADRSNRDIRSRGNDAPNASRPNYEGRDRNNNRPNDRNHPPQRDGSNPNHSQNNRPKPHSNRPGNFRNNSQRNESRGGDSNSSEDKKD